VVVRCDCEFGVEIFVVNSLQIMRILIMRILKFTLEFTSHDFTSSGATYFFADNATNATRESVLVSAPFTTEFSGVTPNPGSNPASREEVPRRLTRFR
jgi:hypothetical protein